MMVTPDNLAAIIVFIGKTKTDADLKLMTDIVRDQAKQVEATAEAEFSVGGVPAISADLLSRIPEDAFKITLMTFLLVALILCLIFRSPKFGLISTMPICLALVWEFGAFYVFGIPLNLITVLISSLLIGIGIDFSIHFTHRYMEELKNRPMEPEESVRSAIFHVGRPALVATATTCGAFALLMISRIPAIGTFGLMTALVILFCLIATLFVLPPALVHLTRRIEEKGDPRRLKRWLISRQKRLE
jgi:predicted RND superfamily exporter protein